ncbi:MAG: BMC domain-containing protein [Synergistaceae bacterium]|nr:BMC domain-containing protein [Synergistaceae bacterium]
MSEDFFQAEKKRFIQEFVPGKQVTIAHVIANPNKDICERIGIDNKGAAGIMTITPGEGAIIAADAASKSSNIKVEFVDRFTGALVFSGDVAAVESALINAMHALCDTLGFDSTAITRS